MPIAKALLYIELLSYFTKVVKLGYAPKKEKPDNFHCRAVIRWISDLVSVVISAIVSRLLEASASATTIFWLRFFDNDLLAIKFVIV